MRSLSPVLLASVFLAATAPASSNDPGNLTVHEWGTFTSIAGPDGDAVSWIPLSGPDDLPCFVDRLQFGPKYSLWGTVRMETPVLYFYATEPADVSVHVRFRQGLITEWFPRAAVTPAKFPQIVGHIEQGLAATEGTATWRNVRVLPRAAEDYPFEPGASHYYAARATDAAPIKVGEETEKFLFYRGVAAFEPPMSATVAANGTITVKAASGVVGDIVLFENRGGRVAYKVHRASSRAITLDPQASASASPDSLKPMLETILVAQGLYPKEARAMIATWGDSWFEEGARVFYIAPRSFIDSVLPLEITPVAAETARVFVGRLELVTRATVREVKDALLRHDLQTARKYGRFLDPIVTRVLSESTPTERASIARAQQSLMSSWRPPLSRCR